MNFNPTNIESYHYIIIGAGSAGCVVANRLSESPKHRVLLLEAGGSDDNFWIKVPLGYAKTFMDPSVNWCFSTQADPGLNGRLSYWPRGRVIGGSSSINAMSYFRGLPHDFNDWELAGATGWNWNIVNKTYEQLESNDEIDSLGNRKIRGSGPVWVSDLSDQMHPFSQYFLQGARDLGWPVSYNINSNQNEGLSPIRSTVRSGRRWSAADAFLKPVKHRQNLRILTSAIVQKIVLEKMRATGLIYRQGEKLVQVHAYEEVIVCAGAINSPHLLQLSGIGPPDLLKRHGITIENSLNAVGCGLQDHLALSHYYRAKEPTLNNQLGWFFGKITAGIHYLLTRCGPLSVPINQISGFIRSDNDVSSPDVQVYCNPISYKIQTSGLPKINAEASFLLSAQPCRPSSRGTIQLASSNPLDAPLIQPNSLSTDEDRDMAIKVGKILQTLTQAPSIQEVTQEPLLPDITVMNDKELLENFRNRAQTVFHPSCTCRMGRSKKDSVLDSKLRVHGISSLRVIDASSFPNITSGNTNAPTLMLASRASDFILEEKSG
ncbi:GMC family oxidoreductase [Candidatus Endowatersipora endosymbiont of Watersipora subatra]|uniref:GMC family oxidoreductase n=1 Tax=Candidatus Endowatersipora endosymbiont of Watersipora subatra TaxID=3077946 RepID=UPI00312C9B13